MGDSEYGGCKIKPGCPSMGDWEFGGCKIKSGCPSTALLAPIPRARRLTNFLPLEDIGVVDGG